MSLTDQPTLRVVLADAADGQPWPAEERFALTSALLEKGYTVAPDVEQARGTVVVLGRRGTGQLQPRPTAAAGDVLFRDISGLDTSAVIAAVDEVRTGAKAAAQDWKPWFPVIDYERCTNCMQCLSFCLFGVYGVDQAQRITVQTSENCKTNCPACSRVCPEAAIMFPKYKSGPINGDVVSDADLQREKMKIDISALLGGDVYSMLRERSERAKSRFSKERDSNKALDERKKCLTKLAQAAEIPPEVLMSLPSPDEIARRAEEAKARAQAALNGEDRRPKPEGSGQRGDSSFRDQGATDVVRPGSQA